MVTPYHLLLGNTPMSALLRIPPRTSPPEHEPALQTTPSSAPAATGSLPQSKWQYNSPDWVEIPSLPLATPSVAFDEPPHSKHKEEMSLHKALTRNQLEAFSRDSQLVCKAREEYY